MYFPRQIGDGKVVLASVPWTTEECFTDLVVSRGTHYDFYYAHGKVWNTLCRNVTLASVNGHAEVYWNKLIGMYATLK